MKHTLCAQCRSAPAKYKCPLDHVDYCSLACFKLHKATACHLSAPSTTAPAPAAADATLTPTSNDRRPTKRLKSLHWPLEPSSSFWDDPLQRDDVKPLRSIEYEALATHVPLRPLLVSPALHSLSTSLLALPTRKAQERALRVLLGVDADAPSTVYRPGEPTRGGRGTRGRGRGRGGGATSREAREGDDGLVWATQDERGALRKVVHEISHVLERVREGKGER